ncbi:MAG: M20/M25/M40 family metallo-hydrolase [Gemmatimonadota bacterium]|nr:M20/M25/M40 family metallo-hydrolase [Gemmatimonadota bacterium]
MSPRPPINALAVALAFTVGVAPAVAQTPDYEAEIAALTAHGAVQRAMEIIEAEDAATMRDLRELTQIPAPPFMETERGARFREMLEEAGVDSTWVDAEGNVIGLRRGSGGDEVIAITGHLDTVFPEGTDVSIEERGDTLHAPGVADDTRGLAALLAMLRAMNEAEVTTSADVLFVGTVGEEGLGDLRGVKHLFREGGPRIDAFISIDGTGHAGITHQALGSHRYRVTFRGPGGHSWGAFGLANPQHALGRAIHHFDVAADAVTQEGPRTSYNVGRIGGGTSVNSIPFEGWMEVDMRSESPASLDRIDAVFQRAMNRALEEMNTTRREGEPLTLELDMIGDRPSGEIPEDDPFVQRAIAVTRHIGAEPRLGRSSTDANTPISMGIPAMTIGGGGVGGGAHSLDEWFVNEDGPLGIQRAMLILLAQAGIPGTS